MLKALMSDGTYIFGLEAENIKRLTNGDGICINLEEMGGKGRIFILYGETLTDIKKELEEMTGCRIPSPEEYFKEQNKNLN